MDKKAIIGIGILGALGYFLASRNSESSGLGGDGSFGGVGGGDVSTEPFGDAVAPVYTFNFPETPAVDWGDSPAENSIIDTESTDDSDGGSVAKILTAGTVDNSKKQVASSKYATVNDVAGANEWIDQNVGSENVKYIGEVMDLSENERTPMIGDGTYGATSLGNVVNTDAQYADIVSKPTQDAFGFAGGSDYAGYADAVSGVGSGSGGGGGGVGEAKVVKKAIATESQGLVQQETPDIITAGYNGGDMDFLPSDYKNPVDTKKSAASSPASKSSGSSNSNTGSSAGLTKKAQNESKKIVKVKK